MVSDDRKYSQEHEWVQLDGEHGVVGVTDFAASELGDVVFVELPETGSEFSQGDTVGTIESVKAVADLFIPVSGEIVDRYPELPCQDQLAGVVDHSCAT